MPNISKHKQILVFSLLALFLLGGQALGKVTITKDVPEPLKLNIEDLGSATIQSPSSMTVYVVASATESSKGRIAEVTTEKFEIKSGVNRYTAANLPPFAKTWIASEYKQLIERRGVFPEGNYTILIQLFTEKDSLLDDDEIRHEVRYTQIRLIAPPDGAEITEHNPVLVWITTRPIPGVEYQLVIYEVMYGQTKTDAIHNVPWFEQDGITTPSFSYPLDARAFEPDKSYCWQVEAFTYHYGDYHPIATSEIWGFSQEGKAPPIDGETAAAGDQDADGLAVRILATNPKKHRFHIHVEAAPDGTNTVWFTLYSGLHPADTKFRRAGKLIVCKRKWVNSTLGGVHTLVIEALDRDDNSLARDVIELNL